MTYDEPKDCAKSDDGKTFKEHQMTVEQYNACHQLAAMLIPLKLCCDVFEATQKPTSNLIKPFVGKMIDRLDRDKKITTEYRGRKEVIKVNCCFLLLLLPAC